MRRSNVPLLLAIVVEAMAYGAIFGLLADLQDKFGFEQNGLGLIAAVAFPAALVGQLGLSRYADRGYTRKLLWFGLATAAAGMIWFWLGDTLFEFVFARVLVGLGSGTFIPAARRIILSHNPHNPGQAISMAGAADIGGFVLGIPVAKGLEQYFNSPNTPFLVLAIALLIVGPLATLSPEPPIIESHSGGAEVRKVFSIPLARAGIFIGLGFAAIIGTFDAIAARFLKDLGGTDSELIIVMIALFVPLVVAMPFAGKLVDHHGPTRCGTIALLVAAPLVVGFGLTRDLVFIGILGGLVALGVLGRLHVGAGRRRRRHGAGGSQRRRPGRLRGDVRDRFDDLRVPRAPPLPPDRRHGAVDDRRGRERHRRRPHLVDGRRVAPRAGPHG